MIKGRFRLLKTIREFFDRKGYLEVETPELSPYATLDANIASFESCLNGFPLYLQTSPEYYMKELLSMGFDSIFQLCKAFRYGEIGKIHNPEFTILEWYITGHDYNYMMRETEELVREVLGEKIRKDWEPPFERRSIRELFAAILKIDLDRCLTKETLQEACLKSKLTLTSDGEWEDLFFKLLLTYIEPTFKGKAVFLCDYPEKLGSMARPSVKNSLYAERFELYLDGIEICNGFSELTDAGHQKKRFVSDQTERRLRGQPVYEINDRFLEVLSNGLPACTGNALGVDRLYQVLTGEPTIHSFLPFSFRNHRQFQK
ncbi:MAG: EF-P lysine aminoacylase EpmA [Candidatus Wallbacteria bacterium]|nr:EF-P lysine aminoacylase EpmA [Candidatus Wallbacteria bacterium]